MSIPPWILAIIVLIMVAGLGTWRLAAKYGLPEGFALGTSASEGFALGNSPMLIPSSGNSQSEGFATGAERQGRGTSASEGFTAPMSSRYVLIPPLAYPNNTPGKYVMQAYGIYDKAIHPGSLRDDDVKESFTATHAQQKLYPGVDHNVTVAQKPVEYSGTLSEDTNTPLTQQLAIVQAVAKGNIPTEQNLAMINGGSDEAANVKLSQAYKPHQEKIYPDQHPRTQHSQLTAGAPTDSGTMAEDIQKTTVRTPSVREMVREEERDESESFDNPYAVRYQSI